MTRFSIKALLLFTATIAVIVWWNDPGFRVIHDESHPSYGRFVVHAKRGNDPGKINVRVTFYPPATSTGDAQISGTMTFEIDEAASFKIESALDDSLGTWCLYDTCDSNFVIVAVRSDSNTISFGNFWHPGRQVGWARGFWAKLFDEIKTTHPHIPYDRLPSEAMIQQD